MYGDSADLMVAKSDVRYNCGGASVSTAPIAPVPSELRNLERSVNRLDELIGQLAGRIEPTCRIEGPQADRGSEAREARARANSGLGTTIANCADQIDGLSARVTGLLRRCEL